MSTYKPAINDNPVLQGYYYSLESRIGYRLILGGTRHYGYYKKDTLWPFPIGGALRAMEEQLFLALDLPKGSRVLDSGCGAGHVALYMARRGLRITAIDVVEHHVEKARRTAKKARATPEEMTVQRMDYHHLGAFSNSSYDGVYTMETFVHATDPATVLAGYYRILRPGGHIAMFEYDNHFDDPKSQGAQSMTLINKWSAMPMNQRSHPGVYKKMLEDAGFTDIVVRDFSENVRPMLRLFYVLAIVPYYIITFLGLEKYFINTIAGVEGYRQRKHLTYVAISARKPTNSLAEPLRRR
jgi:sterol 24-C-methyltransferase